MTTRFRATLVVLIGATLLGSMGAWGRAVYRFEGDPMVVVTWRAVIGVAALTLVLAATRPALLRIASPPLPSSLGLRDLSASQVSIVATWEVVTAAVLGWLLFGEHLTPVQIGGAALVCTGIAWIQRTDG